MVKTPAGIDLVQFSLEHHGAVPALGPEEVRRAAGIENPLLRSRYVRTRTLVRRVLAARLGLEGDEIVFTQTPQGKPEIAAPAAPCKFSISHSGDILVVAAGEIPLGVDVEVRRARRNILALAERFFSEADFAMLRGVPDSSREEMFLRQWVAKEAALKALGSGLGTGLRRAECECLGGRVRAVHCGGKRVPIVPFDLADGTPGAVGWLGGEGAAIRWRNPADFDAEETAG